MLKKGEAKLALGIKRYFATVVCFRWGSTTRMRMNVPRMKIWKNVNPQFI